MFPGRHLVLLMTVLTVLVTPKDATTCGGSFTDESGLILSPNYPSPYNVNESCSWTISLEKGHVVKLMFHEPFELEGPDVENECSHDSVKVFEIMSSGTRNMKGSWCGTNVPPEFLSSTPEIVVEFNSDNSSVGRGFSASWLKKVYHCGKTFSLDDEWGSFHSPNYPFPYDNDTFCQWTINVLEGYAIKLVFDDFSLQYSYNDCPSDSVKVFEYLINGERKLTGTWCGDRKPGIIISSGLRLDVEFKSDGSINSTGFSASWFKMDMNCGGTFNDARRIVMSPNYPSPYNANTHCKWIARVGQNKALRLMFFQPFDVGNDCVKVTAVLPDEKRVGKGTWCNTNMPNDLLIHASQIEVEFNSDNSSVGSGFSMAWLRTDSYCGGSLTIGDDASFISSPNYRFRYVNNLFCRWNIRVNGNYFIKLAFHQPFQLENCCNCDYVKVFDIQSNGQENLRGTWCGTNTPPVIMSSTSKIVVEFKTDGSATGKGFSATLSKIGKVCQNFQDNVQQIVRSPNYPLVYPDSIDCKWDLQVPTAQFIELVFHSDFDLGSKGDKSCGHDKIEIYDVFGNETLISRGSWCGSNAPPPLKSLGSKLIVEFHSDKNNITNGHGFFAQWKAATDCGGVFKGNKGYIMSYNYNNYDNNFRNKRCAWEIQVEDNFEIALRFESSFPNGYCKNFEIIGDYVNMNVSNPRQGWCSDNMENIITSLNHKLVVVFHPTQHNTQPFFASWSSRCGHVFDMDTGNFSSPSYGTDYPPDLDCEWVITGAQDHIVHLYFRSPFDLEAKNDGSCDYDYLQVFDSFTNDTLVSKGIFCGQSTPPPLVSSTSKMVVRFHSDEGKSGKGFSVSWSTACGDIYYSQHGNITSPKFPQHYPDNFDCRWEIQVKEGYLIRLSFMPPFSVEESVKCEADYLELYDVSIKGDFINKRKFCGDQLPPTETSESSKMVVVFHSDNRKASIGFHAIWNAVCGDVFNTAQGYFTSPGYPSSYPNNHDCVWEIHVTPGQRVRLQFDSRFDLELNRHGDCGYDDVEVFDYFSNGTKISSGRWCGVQTPPVMISVSEKLEVLFHSDSDKSGGGFKVFWDTVGGCNNTFSTDKGFLMTPNYPSNYPPDQHCQWEIIQQGGANITFRFDPLFDVEFGADCAWDYVQAFEDDVEIGQWCGKSPPLSFTTNAERTVITFHSDKSNNGNGFFVSWTTST